MGYFSLRCFDPQVGRYIIIVLDVIVGILGITHWGYAGLFGEFKYMLKKINFNTGLSGLNEAFDKIADSNIAYFSVSGIIQLLLSVLVMLLIFGVLGKDRQLLWVRFVMVMLMIQFAFSFFIAVYSTMQISYWNILFKDSLKTAFQYVEIAANIDDQMRRYYLSLINFIRFTMAEAIITWIIALPSIAIILVSLTDQLVTEENVYKIIQENPQNATKNNVQINPLPQNSLADINIGKK